jgi:diguanylate cyclase (GGDEF)-like protein
VLLPPLTLSQSQEFDARRTQAKLPHAGLFLTIGILFLLLFALREVVFGNASSYTGLWLRALGAAVIVAEFLIFRRLGLARYFRATTLTVYCSFFMILLGTISVSPFGWAMGLPGLIITMMASVVVLLRGHDALCNIPLALVGIGFMWAGDVRGLLLLNNTAYLLIGAASSVLFAYVLENIARTAFVSQLRLEQEAQHDYLTNLVNRRYLATLAQREISRAQRFERPLSVMLVDIDHFKKVNDQYGHDTGDQVIREMGQLLAQQMRASDVVGRHGGEEFALLLPETTREEAMHLAQRLCASVAKHRFMASGTAVPLTISVGVAAYEGGTQDWSALLKQADAAMYSAKQQGRDRVVIAAPQPITA